MKAVSFFISTVPSLPDSSPVLLSSKNICAVFIENLCSKTVPFYFRAGGAATVEEEAEKTLNTTAEDVAVKRCGWKKVGEMSCVMRSGEDFGAAAVAGHGGGLRGLGEHFQYPHRDAPDQLLCCYVSEEMSRDNAAHNTNLNGLIVAIYVAGIIYSWKSVK
nr:hypothetical protein Iba_scaffold1866CG0210 [Ipomoea batatas]